jgi:hypothetical protein
VTNEDRAKIVVTARLLAAAGKLDTLATGLTLIAAAAVVFGSMNVGFASIAIALGLIAKHFSVRMSLDARLLQDVASDSLSTADLDAALTALELAPPEKAGRDWGARCRGARRLIVALVVTTLCQFVIVVLA